LQRLVKLSGDAEFEVTWFELLHNLRLTLMRVREKTNLKLTNNEAITALANLIESRRLRSKGLIYELKSPNPNIQEATDNLRMIVEHYEKSGGNQNGRYLPSELDGCIRYFHQQAKTANRKGVDFLGLLSLTVGKRFIGLTESIKSKEAKINTGLYPPVSFSERVIEK